jgi:hypothetical protein
MAEEPSTTTRMTQGAHSWWKKDDSKKWRLERVERSQARGVRVVEEEGRQTKKLRNKKPQRKNGERREEEGRREEGKRQSSSLLPWNSCRSHVPVTSLYLLHVTPNNTGSVHEYWLVTSPPPPSLPWF